MKRRFTWHCKERGLRTYAKFKADYGEEVRLQTSSAASGHYVWIFLKDSHDSSTDSAHMNRKQAEKLRDGITRWLEDTAPTTAPAPEGE